jgi:hypothetical protein
MMLHGLAAFFLVLFPMVLHAESSSKGSDWHWGAYVDLSYPANFNTSEPHLWRSKLTTRKLSQFSPNLGMVYLRKDISAASSWGLELAGQAGYDTAGQLPAYSPLAGADTLQYVSRANISYLAPIGTGLKLTAGLFNSFIGCESFYAKDNSHYTRAWMADYSPYFLIGGGAQYALNAEMDAGFYLLTDWNYLQSINALPKYGLQYTWRLRPGLKWMQNFFVGPEQTQTAIANWRVFSNTMLEHTADDYTLTMLYDVGTEHLQGSTGPDLQAFWTASALTGRWNFSGPWSVAMRPELYWDANGLMTGYVQFIKAITTTLEYRFTDEAATGRIRLEYRYDNSTGQQGGFYGAGGIDAPLVAGQSTLFMALLLSFDQ